MIIPPTSYALKLNVPLWDHNSLSQFESLQITTHVSNIVLTYAKHNHYLNSGGSLNSA